MKQQAKPILILFTFLHLLNITAQAQTTKDTTDDGTIQPMVAIQPNNYAKVRKTFASKLIKRTHAPSRLDTIASVPTGVTQFEFLSNDPETRQPLHLKAWANFPAPGIGLKYPVVIFLHGGFAFEKEDWDMAKPFRDAGFLVVTPILRGEDGQQGNFSMFYNEVDDVLALATYLEKLPVVDKHRIFVAGHSVGGTVALLAAMASKQFKKAVSFSASPDQEIYCRYGINPKFIPFDTTNKKEFQVRSPLSYAASFNCPVRMYYGTREPHFHLSTIETVAIAKRKGLDVECRQVEGGHEDAVPEAMKLAIEFFLNN